MNMFSSIFNFAVCLVHLRIIKKCIICHKSIRKYGKEKLLHVHDKLNEVYDFKKAQELLVTDAKTGLKILENENDGGENHAEN